MNSTTPVLSDSNYSTITKGQTMNLTGQSISEGHETDFDNASVFHSSNDSLEVEEEGMFRSEKMTMIEIVAPSEQVKSLNYDLGNFGMLHFIKQERHIDDKVMYQDEIRILKELQRQYTYFEELLNEYKVTVIEDSNDSGILDNFYVPKTNDIESLCKSGYEYEQKFISLRDNLDELKSQELSLLEHKLALEKLSELLFRNSLDDNTNEITGMTITSRHNDTSSSRNFITGTVATSKMPILEKLLWRVTRGNLYLTSLPIESDELPEGKTSFLLFVYGENIRGKCTKVIESLEGNLIDLPVDNESQKVLHHSLKSQLNELSQIIESTQNILLQDLNLISMELPSWEKTIEKELRVMENMSEAWLFTNGSTASCKAWIPTSEHHSFLINYKQDNVYIHELEELKRTPPTFHRTNKFTQAFQDICDCYGIAKYREINAGLPTIVTFPFMFAIMFGDLGHGLILTMVALVLVLNEKKINRWKRDEIFDMAFGGRYILLLMGVFSCFTGFIYNDIFSKTLTLFKTGWSWKPQEGRAVSTGHTYSMGLDYNWHGTENGLLFSNSLKMKLSILMGFIHMTYSYMFSLINYINEKSMIDVIGNFIPGLVFMQSIFGYLSICIVYKWSVDWVKDNKPAPGLLNMLINMFLSPGNIEAELYPHQAKVQIVLLLLALVCVPCLLLIKPIHFKLTHKKKLNELEESQDDEEDESFGDVLIHQVIHTIEFCLNCVSHTASYLRLWALSLAHAQLSDVLWTMTIKIGLEGGKKQGLLPVLMLFFLFGMWFVLTVLVLVVMEGTSAMLHSLRLHWVESMSKFFVGEGLPYEPFKFSDI
ncbi:related to V-type proton ATPase subunit a, vacuolar isoform [Hanseniaspora guilliermondii]|uniref:V-type proton ATPase subunit a n=1 Tax=Hanseniaspora guilliermondii TaxID=56406 RepID=A0A1L0FMD6_9ASCO|nr:related to V-type proton ATPase subunit a, vacuolar isoform [Hanseniaspora guilliermondii]